VYDQLQVADIFRLSKTCRLLHDFTGSYWTSQICLSRILSPYTTSNTEVDLFRYMMLLTGAIISGSTAFQAFARIQYDDSDLDLYVHCTKAAIVQTFLATLAYDQSDRASDVPGLAWPEAWGLGL
ncbi:hypothetical protein F5887DRAFT_889107, partial [Amanita rubescens]